MRLRPSRHTTTSAAIRAGGARRAAPLAAALLLAAPLAACSDDSADSATDPGAGEGGGTGIDCTYADDGRDASKENDGPPSEAQYDGDVDVTISLGQGDVGATLDGAKAPCTVNSFTALADQGYFDDTPCHRLTTQGIFVLQCGDPTGSGSGGPGYSFADEVDPDDTYPAGTIAMANAGPDTNGSQFFLVYADTELPPAYTVFGQLDQEGLDVVSDIAAAGAQGGAPDGPPAEDVTIEGVTVG